MTTPIRPEPSSNSISLYSVTEKEAKGASDANLLLLLPKDLRTNVVKSLTENDLDALEISLSKGELVQDTFKPAQKHLQELIVKTRQTLTYQNLLKDHPDWKPIVEGWPITLEEKIWLMHIHELAILNVFIPGMNELYSGKTTSKNFVPEKNSIDLLKQRESISKTLGQITEFSLHEIGITKCPNAICLFVNLKKLSVREINLSEPPDLRLNTQLEELEISECNQLTDPPDLRCNEKLTILSICLTGLNRLPSLAKNLKLERINLSNNPLSDEEKGKLEALQKERDILVEL